MNTNALEMDLIETSYKAGSGEEACEAISQGEHYIRGVVTHSKSRGMLQDIKAVTVVYLRCSGLFYANPQPYNRRLNPDVWA